MSRRPSRSNANVAYCLKSDGSADNPDTRPKPPSVNADVIEGIPRKGEAPHGELIRSEGQGLIHFEAARAALVQAQSIDDVRSIRDKAEATRAYAKQARLSLEMQNQCAELKLRAERRAGELLREMPKASGGQPYQSHAATGSSEKRSHTATISLSDLGVTKSDSSRWQRIAGLTEEAFESYVHETTDAKRELTTAGALKLAKRHRALDVEGSRTDGEDPADSETVVDMGELVATGRRFGTVYADPAWQYQNQGSRGATDLHYPTMSLDAIAALPVAQLTDDAAHCHLWTTTSFLREAFDVLDAWGFTYKSQFIWVKPQMGMGNYWRVSHEILVLGVKGSCPFDLHDQMSWAEFPRGRHSKKPDEIRDMIARVSPPARLELFARDASPGWTAWGNEVHSAPAEEPTVDVEWEVA